MRSSTFKNIAVLSIALFHCCALAWPETDIPDPMALDQERRMKEDTEHQAQAICDSVFGKGRSSVLANVELGIESTRKGGSNLERKLDNKSGGLGDDNFILPWVPAPKSVTKEETPKDANVQTQAAQQTTVDVKTVLQRFDIIVVHDDTIPQDRVDLAKETLASAFDRYRAVLKIIFRATKFVQDNVVRPQDVVKKNFLDSINLKNIFLLFLLMLAMSLLKFFFGPLANFMREYIEGMKDLSRSKVEMENTSETDNESDSNAENEEETNGTEGELTAEELAALELEQEEAMAKFEPFKYVNDENIRQLAYLLHHEEPWIVAVVISYISAEHAFKVMEALPADLQAKVALETAMYRQTSLEQVRAIDQDIKEKIDFVVGGIDKLIVILESSDRFARENILEYLKNEKPAMYERVREKILLFEDVGNFPKPAMQTVVRELKTEQLARALRGTSPELQQKFFENMSQGAVTLLKEEMQYGRPVTDDQVDEERKKILDLIKTMEKDGKISFRAKGRTDSMDSTLEAAPTTSAGLGVGRGAVDSAGALAAYQEGAAASEQGQWEAAVSNFMQSIQMDGSSVPAHQGLATAYYSLGRYAEAVSEYDIVLQLEPNEELRAWVDQLRANLSTAAA